MSGGDGGEAGELRMIHGLLGEAFAALQDPVNREAGGKAEALAALSEGARGFAQALRRARLTYGDPALDDPRPTGLGWDPELDGAQLSPVASKEAILAAGVFLDLIGDLFAGPDDPDWDGRLAFVPKLAAAKGWRRPKQMTEGQLRRRAAAKRVYQLMGRKAVSTGRKPSQKEAIGIVREETGLPVSKIKLGLSEYRAAQTWITEYLQDNLGRPADELRARTEYRLAQEAMQRALWEQESPPETDE